MSDGGSPTAVIVGNYGTSALLEANLLKVVDGSPELRVVVVDNYTSEQEAAAIEAACARHGWTLIASPTNVGFGSGMNLGAAAALEAGAGQLLLLNPDAWIEGDSLGRLVAVVTDEPMTMVGPVIETTAGTLWSDGHDLYLDRGRMRATRKRVGDPRVVPWLTGACLLISANLWERVAGFDERYFLYWEDVDLSWRVLEAGGELRVVREAVAVHDEGATQARRSTRALSSTYYHYNIRNRLVFAAHHLDEEDRRHWVRTALPEAWAVLLRGGRRQLLRSSAPWRAAATGTLAGLRLLRAAERAGTTSAGGGARRP